MSRLPFASAVPARAKLAGPLQPAWAAMQQQWLTQVQPRWQAMASRERLGVTLALGALALLLLWSIAVAPALATLRQTPTALAALDAQLSQMRTLAAESQELRKQPALPAGQAEAALRSATERLGGSARLSLLGERATITFTAVDGSALLAWLGEARSAARAKPIEAQLTRSGTAYNGSVVLSLPAAP
jgi:general secretion pathway protein M